MWSAPEERADIELRYRGDSRTRARQPGFQARQARSRRRISWRMTARRRACPAHASPSPTRSAAPTPTRAAIRNSKMAEPQVARRRAGMVHAGIARAAAAFRSLPSILRPPAFAEDRRRRQRPRLHALQRRHLGQGAAHRRVGTLPGRPPTAGTRTWESPDSSIPGSARLQRK